MNDKISQPPRLAEKILGLLYSDRGSRTPLGDFAEVYAEMAAQRGPAVAGVWYSGQILRSIPGFLLARFYWSAVMFRNYLVIFFRNLTRDKGTSLINLAGLASGMACFLLILTYVRFETSYDRFHPNAGRIHRLISVRKGMGMGITAPDPLAPLLKAEIPGINRFARIMPPFGKPVLQAGDKQFFQKGFFAEAAFLEIFSFPPASGGHEAALDGPSKIVLTRATAEKFFGKQDAVGKTMIFRDLDKPRDLTVTAVLKDVPSNSHLKFDYLISMDTLRSDKGYSYVFGHWNVANFPTYLELSEGASPAAVETAISAWISRLTAEGNKNRPFHMHKLQALLDIHLKSDFVRDYADTGDLRSVRLFMAIAILVLLIACINHINLATARSAVRAREIGIRKVTGAYRTQVFQQFLAESLAVMVLAGGFALGLIALILPWFGSLVGAPLRLNLVGGGSVLPWLAMTIIFVCLGAGAYPAAILSSLRPVQTLREFSAAGKKGTLLRSVLVVSQFTASVVLIAATVVVFGQMKYVRSMRLGYNREHVVVIPAFEKETDQKMVAIKSELDERPEVVKASLTSGLPTDIGQHWSGWAAVKEDGTKVECDFTCDYVDENFLDVFEIGLAAGRNFRPGDKDVIILNEAAIRDFGWKEPVGKKLKFGATNYEVVGIVEDFHFASLHSRIAPMALLFETGSKLAVRVRPGDLAKTLGVLRSVFEKNTHGQPFDFFFLDDAFNTLYKKETRTGQMFGAFAGLAILIACLGLFGLTSFNVTRRTKEIGVRKVLGASVARLVLLLNRNFIRLVTIANLLAWPLAYVAMNKWLEDFAYRISVRPWIFLLSSLMSLAIAVLVVGGQTVKAARMNPSETLRYE
ncbi:MAG: ABC transporter permease [Candidatus Aminicenantes bacterium]|nr:ABC transporter permease [Candidatus Aminicenantes bacterium]